MKKQYVRIESFAGKKYSELQDYMESRNYWTITSSEEGWTRWLHWKTGLAFQIMYDKEGSITSVIRG